MSDRMETYYTESQRNIFQFSRRDLSTTTNPDGTISEITTAEEVEETKKMSIIYKAFYAMANMGGLYAILMFIFGIFVRPVISKIFNHEVVNEVYIANAKALAYINVLEKNKNEKDKELIRENLLNEEDMIKSGRNIRDGYDQDESVSRSWVKEMEGGEEEIINRDKKYKARSNRSQHHSSSKSK